MLGQISGVSSPHQKKEKLCISLRPQTSDVKPPHSPDLGPLNFYLCTHLKTLMCSAPIEDEDTLNQRIFDARQDIRNRSGIFECVCQSMIKREHKRIDSGEEHFEHLL